MTMKYFIHFCLITPLIFLSNYTLNSQSIFSKGLKMANINNSIEIPTYENFDQDHSLTTGATQLLQNWNDEQILIAKNKITTSSHSKNGDTLYIGEVPNDSVVITGNWFHNGPILILGDGKLVFNNANATIIGDIWVWGISAKLTSNNSTLYFPQEYFYQRTLIAAGKGQFVFNNTHLDFSGLSHNFVATDSAQIIQKNVTKNGFTTNGLSKKSEIHIENTNLAGEFICTDQTKLSFLKTKTILLWHHIPDGATLTHSFPQPDTVSSYHFSNILAGVQNINYTIDIDTCIDVMWAIMPTSGSSTTITNSILRAVGVWFENSGNINVSGIVNNSNYSDYTPSMSDKNLHFINSSVKTWNLYTFKQSELDLSSSIVGEIGSMGKSKVTCQNSMIDGSGGYTWATDTTFLIVGFSSAVNDFRATKNGIALFGYSSLSNGVAMATDNAILIVNQSSLPEFPIAYDQSCVWLNKIELPSSGFQNSMVDIIGSSYIEKTETSNLMDFAWYQLFYKNNIDTIWNPITNRVTTSVKNGLLGQWNTTNISPNNYALKLVLCDNTIDSNKIEAIKSINIQPSILNIQSTQLEKSSFYFNQQGNALVVDPSQIGNLLKVYTIFGTLIQSSTIRQTQITLPNLAQGTYVAELKSLKTSHLLKFVITR